MELTYNYGIDSYAFGNDLQYIAIANPSILTRAKAMGSAVSIVDNNVIQGPDNYRYKIIPAMQGRAEVFAAVGLRVANLQKAKEYWCGVLGMKEFPTPAGLDTSCPSTCVAFAEKSCYLQLIQVDDGQSVDHALSSGRIAFACHTPSVPAIFEAIKAAGETVQVPPLTLPTPGKADVVVTILRDRDDYEICFVEDLAFWDLATPKYDIIDFASRATRGGDGAPPPKGEGLKHADTISDISSQIELDAKIASAKASSASLVVYFGASWCKVCKKITPFIEKLAVEKAGQVQVASVDIAACEDFAVDCDVSSVPRFFVYKAGVKVKDYNGSEEEKLAELFL